MRQTAHDCERRIMPLKAMESRYYSLVAYVSNPVGQFVQELRHELQPEQGELPAHLTILPPRLLSGAESDAVELIENVCQNVQPFEVDMGEVETFLPVTPTVFIRVAHAAYRIPEWPDRLNPAALHFNEPWPYMPHLTILRSDDPERARAAFDVARQRWSSFRGARGIVLDRLTFV